MHIVEILLPRADNDGRRFASQRYDAICRELAEKFGGVTAWSRTPADGLWKDEADRLERNEIVVLEVMTDALDRDWWSAFRVNLEAAFAQDEIVVRASAIERL